jgi:hypothetical protein
MHVVLFQMNALNYDSPCMLSPHILLAYQELSLHARREYLALRAQAVVAMQWLCVALWRLGQGSKGLPPLSALCSSVSRWACALRF